MNQNNNIRYPNQYINSTAASVGSFNQQQYPQMNNMNRHPYPAQPNFNTPPPQFQPFYNNSNYYPPQPNMQFMQPNAQFYNTRPQAQQQQPQMLYNPYHQMEPNNSFFTKDKQNYSNQYNQSKSYRIHETKRDSTYNYDQSKRSNHRFEPRRPQSTQSRYNRKRSRSNERKNYRSRSRSNSRSQRFKKEDKYKSNKQSSSDEEDNKSSEEENDEKVQLEPYNVQTTLIPTYYSKDINNPKLTKGTSKLNELCSKFEQAVVQRSKKTREKLNLPIESTQIPDYRQLLMTNKFDKFTRCKCDHKTNETTKTSCSYHRKTKSNTKRASSKSSSSSRSSSASSSCSSTSGSSSYSSSSFSSTNSKKSGKLIEKKDDEFEDIRSMEIDRKLKHPERLHSELSFNEPDQVI